MMTTILQSTQNGCSYTLWKNSVLYYHPINSNGTLEAHFYKYAEVEWDELDPDELTEADRCYDLLRQSAKQTTNAL